MEKYDPEKFYIAIESLNGGEMYGSNSGSHDNYSKFQAALDKGLYKREVIAEESNLSEEDFNRIIGSDENGIRRRDVESPLLELVKRLNNGEKLNPQEELSKICKSSQ